MRNFAKSLLVLVINLVRQTERWRKAKFFCKGIGVKPERIVATDGQSCLLSGGRCVKQSASTYRLSYDKVSKKTKKKIRIVSKFRPGKLAAHGSTFIWGQYGCSQSHGNALLKVQKAFNEQKVQFALILEDDVTTASNVSTSDVVPCLKNFVRQLDKEYDWVALCLGGQTAICNQGGNGPSRVPGVFHCTRVLQAHGYLWKRTGLSLEILADLIERMHNGGQIADNAYASLQKKYSSAFFFVKPALLVQDEQAGSSLQLASGSGSQKGYATALRKAASGATHKSQASAARKRLPPKVVQALGSSRRGVKKIDRKALQGMRSEFGQAGGSQNAGGGSSCKQIKKKEVAVQKAYESTGVFPSKRVAYRKWGVSQSVWQRMKDKLLSSDSGS